MSRKIFLSVICAFFVNATLTSINAQTALTNDGKPKTTVVQKAKTTKNHELVGKATWYGSNYSSNRRTASGERFNKDLMTAAHKTLPFGTKVKVICEQTGKTVVVKINDRGPFGKGRIIDLSVAAAKELGIIKCGVALVKLEILE